MAQHDAASSILEPLLTGGPLVALLIMVLSVVLLVEGRKRIPMTVGMVGFVVGFGLTGQLYPLVAEQSPIGEGPLRFLGAVIIAIVCVSAAFVTMRFLAAGLVYLSVTTIIDTGWAAGVDLEGDAFYSGLLTLTAFVLSMSFRRFVPAVMAGLVGSLGVMFGFYLLVGWPVERLDGVSAPDAYLAVLGALVSLFLQFRSIRDEDDMEEMLDENPSADTAPQKAFIDDDEFYIGPV